MRKILLLLLLFLVACGPTVTNVDEAFEQINALDQKHGTNYREERVNLIILDREQIPLYLEDLGKIRVAGENDEQEQWVKWVFSFREQMLVSQMRFQEAYLGIGKTGFVSDGFACSDIEDIRKSTLLMDRSWRLAINSTGIMDALMTENPELIKVIGSGNNKPHFYYSSLDSIYTEIKSNVVAMYRLCNYEVDTEYIDRSFMEVEYNKTQP